MNETRIALNEPGGDLVVAYPADEYVDYYVTADAGTGRMVAVPETMIATFTLVGWRVTLRIELRASEARFGVVALEVGATDGREIALDGLHVFGVSKIIERSVLAAGRQARWPSSDEELDAMVDPLAPIITDVPVSAEFAKAMALGRSRAALSVQQKRAEARMLHGEFKRQNVRHSDDPNAKDAYKWIGERMGASRASVGRYLKREGKRGGK